MRLVTFERGGMDELAAAAAVVAMATDVNAPEDLGQRDACVNFGVGDVAMADEHNVPEDKENNDVHAAAAEIEDAASKVTIAPRVLRPAPYTQPLTQ